MKKYIHQIAAVEPESIAWECGLEPGDAIAAINDQRIEDIFDYQYLIQEEFIRVLVLTKDGEECLLEIEKEEDEDLGITFSSSLMDEYHSCCNKCIFCFIDQMPPGMRETLYFKDDDSRLSFLQGNYITLTNMSDADIDRVIRYHLAPINISVHATDPALRCRMLHNRFAGDVMRKIRRFYDAGIPMNSQIVLCKGINDGEQLDRSIRDLGEMLPFMESLSVVPVGLTRFREGLAPLEAFTSRDAELVLEQIGGWQEHFRREHGTAFVHASDEWFILAGRDFPQEEYYEGYGQLENGVGMMRLLISEVEDRLREVSGELGDSGSKGKSVLKDRDLVSAEKGEMCRQPGQERQVYPRRVSIATGKLAYPTIRTLVRRITETFPEVSAKVYCIENTFFGEKITVAGLLTGQDLIGQLKGRELGDELLLPCNMLRAGEDVFLDDVTLDEMQQALQVPINIIQSEGADLVDKVIGSRLRPCKQSGTGM